MDKVNNYLLDAIETIVDKRLSEAAYDYTQIGTIVDTLGGGKYVVEANGEKFNVESSFIGLRKLDKVYVITRMNNKHKRYIGGTFGERIMTDTGINGSTLTPSEIDDLVNTFTF